MCPEKSGKKHSGERHGLGLKRQIKDPNGSESVKVGTSVQVDKRTRPVSYFLMFSFGESQMGADKHMFTGFRMKKEKKRERDILFADSMRPAVDVCRGQGHGQNRESRAEHPAAGFDNTAEY